jgi:hypothetical protein
VNSIACETVDVDLSPTGAVYRNLNATKKVAGRELLDAVCSQIMPTLKPLAQGVHVLTGGRHEAEAASLAKVHGVAADDLVLANISYDLAVASLGCSTALLASPEGPVLARNMDWMPEALLAKASVLLRTHRDGEWRYTNAGFPGSMGVVSGLSARGFAVVLNAVSSPEGVNTSGYPVLFFLRKVVEDARDFNEAYDWITTQPLTTSALISLAGSANDQRVIVERSPKKAAPRWAKGNEPLFATNHYRKLYPTEGTEAEWCSRYNRLCALASSIEPGVDLSDELLLRGLTDAGVIQGITAQHIVARPGHRRITMYVPGHLVA